LPDILVDYDMFLNADSWELRNRWGSHGSSSLLLSPLMKLVV
jgi:hypothetical protein